MNTFLYSVILIGAELMPPLAMSLTGATPPPNISQSPAAVKVLDLFQRLQAAQTPRLKGPPARVSFQLTEAEINDYMVYALKNSPRPGLDKLTVKILRDSYFSTFSIVDFDAVERWRPGTIPRILRPVLSSKKEISIDFRIHANDGKTTFDVEKAYFQSVRLPAILVEKVIQVVAARQPEKYDTSKPVPLPFGLRRVWTQDRIVMGEN